jgi:AcrR family transcriptional regulator
MAIDPLTPERRRERTRQHLLDAGAIVFGRRGYHGASLDEVAATAGFTKGAVYSNFKNKEDLFVAVLEQQIYGQIHEVEAMLAEHPHPGPEQLAAIRTLITPTDEVNWTALYLEFVLYALRNPSARELLIAFRRRTRDAVQRLVEQEWTMLGSDPPISARSMATLALALFQGVDLERLIDPEDVSSETANESLYFMLAAASGLGIDVTFGDPDGT